MSRNKERERERKGEERRREKGRERNRCERRYNVCIEMSCKVSKHERDGKEIEKREREREQ